jgi:hypothetical protein
MRDKETGGISVEGPVMSHRAFLVRDRGVSQEPCGVRVACCDMNLGCLRVVPDVYIVNRNVRGFVVRRRHRLLLIWRGWPSGYPVRLVQQGSDSHGPDGQGRSSGTIVTQLVTRQLRGQLRTRRSWPLSCPDGVGVAGFEPTASSSRSNAGRTMTGGQPHCRPADVSPGVRECSPTYAVVVTQFVTHSPACDQ